MPTMTPSLAVALSQMKAGTAYHNPVSTNSVAAQAGIVGVAASMAVVSGNAGMDLSGITALAPGLTAVADPVTGPLVTMASHATMQLTNLPSTLSMLAGQSNLQGSLQGVGASLSGFASGGDLCSNINALLGSIAGAGAALINTILSSITAITAAIASAVSAVVQGVVDAAVAAINIAVSAIVSAVGAISAMIAAEVNLLADALADMLAFANISALFGLLANPCALAIINSVGTPALLAGLKG